MPIYTYILRKTINNKWLIIKHQVIDGKEKQIMSFSDVANAMLWFKNKNIKNYSIEK
jgi:hypothetical protein